MNSRFKIKIQDTGGRERWADADKVFAHLYERYTKTIPNGDKPQPYKEKVEHFFTTIDIEWVSSLKKAYPNVDVSQELESAKMWLLSNTSQAKSNFKKFLNNWMAKAMRTGKTEKPAEDGRTKYEKYVHPVIKDEDVATPEEIREILGRR